MKVVINKCFGGFNLSPLALKRISELKGHECYFFTQDYKVGVHASYEAVSVEEATGSMFFSAFKVPNPNEALPRPLKHWGSEPIEVRKKWNEDYAALSISNRDYERHDPHLVQVVEELGDAASGRCAELAVVEIPDGIEYEISEYDGNEHVAEAHRTWS